MVSRAMPSSVNTHRDNAVANSQVLSFFAFALSDCIVETDPQTARYVRVAQRTALELAIPNYFGVAIGGFWLLQAQIDQLRQLPEFYAPAEAPHVRRAVEAFLKAQTSWIG